LNRPPGSVVVIRARDIRRSYPAPIVWHGNYVHQMILLEEFERTGCQVNFETSHEPDPDMLLLRSQCSRRVERELITDRMRRGRQSKYRAGLCCPDTLPTAIGGRRNPQKSEEVRIEESGGSHPKSMPYISKRQAMPVSQISSRQAFLPHGKPKGLSVYGNLPIVGRFCRTLHYRKPAFVVPYSPHQNTHDTAVEQPPEAWFSWPRFSYNTQQEYGLAQNA
jgi:hypothetical protein